MAAPTWLMTHAAISISLMRITRAAAADSQHGALRCAVGKQVDRVHRPRLADAIDPADALLEADRIPRQLEVDDEPAVALEIQPFRAGIGREQESRRRRS